MAVFMILLSIFLIVSLTWKLFKDYSFRRKLPRGPPIYPFIGNIGQIKFTDLINEFKRLRTMYGDVFSFIIFNKIVIVIKGIAAIKELLVKEADSLSGRPEGITEGNPNNLGLVASDGELWREHRYFALKTLRDFGLGKKNIETCIQEEVREFLQEVKKKEGMSFNIHELLAPSVSNIICSMTLGTRFAYTDKTLSILLEFINSILSDQTRPITFFVPIVNWIPCDPFGAKGREKKIEDVRAFLSDIVQEHRNSFDEENIRDYIDSFLLMQKRDGKHNSTFTDEQLLVSLTDFFVAGTETITTTIRWALLYLIHNPKIQKTMKIEIDKAIGASHIPSVAHKSSLPFCEAVILEVQRIANITPISIPHSVKYDTRYHGYLLPKGAIILPNLTSVAMDADTFSHPEQFNPLRFLDSEGNVCNQNKIIPFSIGRRVCLGESLARQELFIFIVALIQRFELLPENSKNLPSIEGFFGGMYSPKPFKMKVVVRD